MALDGVSVADTVLSLVDGKAGRLVIRGNVLEDLASRLDFEGMAAHLWQDLQPCDVASWGGRRSRLEPLSGLAPLASMRTLLDSPSVEGAEDAVAALPVALAASRGLIWNRGGGGQARELLQTLLAREPHAEEVRALNRYWVTVAEHGMNASTFTARVVASTRARPTSCVIAALCALEGPLHGGAPGPVLDMLDELRAVSDRKAWLAARVRSGERLMGFGHRIYKVRDPRSVVLRDACRDLLGARASATLEFASQVESEAQEVLADLKPGRQLETNVEFYTAILLDALGFRRHEFTAVFACGRVLGWLAHVAEQVRDGRLIRPESHYVGADAVLAGGAS